MMWSGKEIRGENWNPPSLQQQIEGQNQAKYASSCGMPPWGPIMSEPQNWHTHTNRRQGKDPQESISHGAPTPLRFTTLAVDATPCPRRAAPPRGGGRRETSRAARGQIRVWVASRRAACSRIPRVVRLSEPPRCVYIGFLESYNTLVFLLRFTILLVYFSSLSLLPFFLFALPLLFLFYNPTLVFNIYWNNEGEKYFCGREKYGFMIEVGRLIHLLLSWV